MTPEEFRKIRSHLEGVSPGPWNADFTDDDFQVKPNNGCIIRDGNDRYMMRIDEAYRKEDALFIMFARRDVELLLRTVEDQARSIETQKAELLRLRAELANKAANIETLKAEILRLYNQQTNRAERSEIV